MTMAYDLQQGGATYRIEWALMRENEVHWTAMVLGDFDMVRMTKGALFFEQGASMRDIEALVDRGLAFAIEKRAFIEASRFH